MHNLLSTCMLLLFAIVFIGTKAETQSPFSKLGYKKQVMYTSSKGEFEEFHGNPDVVEIGSVYFDTKTNKVIGYISEEKEKTEVASAISAISIDPLCEKYYWISPYAYCLNNPVKFVDPDGRVVMNKQLQKAYPELTKYMKNLSNDWASKSSEFKRSFMEKSGLNEKQIKTMLTFGKGPKLEVADLDKKIPTNGETVGIPDAKTGKIANANNGNGIIRLDDNVVSMLENAQTGKDRQVGIIMVESTTYHEFTHFGNLITSNTFDGNFKPDSGKAFEIDAFGKDINRSNVNGYWQSIQPQPIPTPAVPLIPVQQVATPLPTLNY